MNNVASINGFCVQKRGCDFIVGMKLCLKITKFYSPHPMHFLIQPCISLLNYIKIT